RYAPRFLPLAERLSRSACNRNCANGKPCLLCRLNQVFSRRGKNICDEGAFHICVDRPRR
ncbi:hypothetical protein EV363DRAFT_1171510, partial [Boletus edulis]